MMRRWMSQKLCFGDRKSQMRRYLHMWGDIFDLQLSGCLPKILITQIGHKIDFLQILYVNCTLSLKTLFVWALNAFFDSVQGGSPDSQKWTFYWYKNANFQ